MRKTEPFTPSPQLRLPVETESGQKVLLCNQCGKCSAGCPAIQIMDGGPRKVIRALQLGLVEEAISSTTIWYCLFCFACGARCPMGIDIPRVLETLRLKAIEEKRKPAVKEVETFHRLFLGQVKSLGRVHELGLGGFFSLKTGKLPPQTRLLPGLFLRGKLPLLPHRFSQLKALFSRSQKGHHA